MTARRRGVALTPMETRRDVMVRTARLADELGYEVFALPEGWGLDSTAVLAEIALSTERIQLVSGVLSVWGRTPGTLAMTAATLDQISGGRYVLGLGASTRALAEGFHDVPFAHPADRLEDTVTAVRALLAGEPAHAARTPDARPLRLGLPPAPRRADLGRRPGPAHHAGRPPTSPTGGSPRSWPSTGSPRWAHRLERPPARPFTVTAGPLAVVDDDAEHGPGRRRRPASPGTCAPWATSTPSRSPGRATTPRSRPSAPRTRGPAPAPAASRRKPRRSSDQLAAAGSPEQVRAQLDRWDDVADIVMVGLPPGAPVGGHRADAARVARHRRPSGVPRRRRAPRSRLGTGAAMTAPGARRRRRRYRANPVRGPLNALFFGGARRLPRPPAAGAQAGRSSPTCPPPWSSSGPARGPTCGTCRPAPG